MARKHKLPPGRRKELREARLLTLISAVFVVTGAFMIGGDAVLLGIVAVVFFSAGLLYGITQWRDVSPRRAADGADDGSGDGSAKAFVLTLMVAAVLLGLGCLGVVVLALTSWDTFGFATTALFPRILVAAAGAVGVVLFLGGAIMTVRRGIREERRSRE